MRLAVIARIIACLVGSVIELVGGSWKGYKHGLSSKSGEGVPTLLVGRRCLDVRKAGRDRYQAMLHL